MPNPVGRPAPVAGWPALILPLLLVLALGPAAPAAPAADSVKFAMDVAPRSALLKPMCIGQSQTFYVSITRTTTKSIGDRLVDSTAMVLGITVSGAIDDAAVGSLTQSSADRYTGGVGLQTYQTVEFTFKAIKAGTTTLRFKGKVDWHWLPGATDESVQVNPEGYTVPVEAVVTVKVRPCRVKASAVHRWSSPGAVAVGTMDETDLTANDEGHFTGSGTIQWIVGAIVPECVTTDVFAPSQVELSGDMDDSGQLAVALTYAPAVDSATIRCESPGRGVYEDRSWTVEAAPSALAFQVSAFGGVSMQAQVLTGSQSAITGDAVVVVLPADDEAPAAALSRLLGGGAPDFLAGLLASFAPRPTAR